MVGRKTCRDPSLFYYWHELCNTDNVSQGEGINNTRIRPELIRELVKRVNHEDAVPFLTETSTLYKGERHNLYRARRMH
ncbi:hypothetical protein [Sporomusa acidovorans]|uniref:hypothetical protein n=1 Tax=Sporomusa acidovorans TaxID=112900 RepID=UPI000B815478|nr:hypothetical protein [Sporomusa acidovorans]